MKREELDLTLLRQVAEATRLLDWGVQSRVTLGDAIDSTTSVNDQVQQTRREQEATHTRDTAEQPRSSGTERTKDPMKAVLLKVGFRKDRICGNATRDQTRLGVVAS
jgi:hypothetical protein